MTAVAGQLGTRRVRLAVPAAVAGLVVAVAALAAVVRDEDGAGARRAQLAALRSYEDAVEPAARDGGRVVEQGMKLAVSALAADRPLPVAMQAVGWVQALEQVRRRFAAATPPPGLEAAAASFDRALAGYRAAAETLGAAGLATGDVRARLLAQAVAAARQADAAYDEASGLLQAHRARLGLPPNDRFPGGRDDL